MHVCNVSVPTHNTSYTSFSQFEYLMPVSVVLTSSFTLIPVSKHEFVKCASTFPKYIYIHMLVGSVTL